MLSEELRRQLLIDFNGEAVHYPQDRTILQLFEDVAAGRPAAPAVTFGGTTLTYAQLNRRANAVAERLQQHGVGRGDLVPLVMRNGLELPIAMLASMKLAAPFVPIDDLSPADRVEQMTSLVDPKVILCGPVRGHVPARPVALVVDASEPAERDDNDFGRPAGMDDVIYGFYTSGSTGLPKCALNLHRGLLNRFLYMSRRFGGGADQVVLQNSRHVFDSSLWQLLWPLTTGSQVIIPARDGLLDLSATVDIVRRHRTTMTDFVPSIFNALVELLTARPELVDGLRSMRHILIGGEEINAPAVQAFRKLLPEIVITNTYGPTEASIGSVMHTVTDADGDSIPIGKPIDNTYAVIVDDQMRLLPPGEVGELFIGGDCLGLGYLGDAEKTRAAFVDNPFPEIPGSRLYRTGDLGSYRPDGCLQFSGRTDQQVKIGGVRVELSELELAMLGHDAVREAVVVVTDTGGARRLAAFLTCRGSVTVEQLREHARSVLPPYLVPKQFVILEAMPLTPNGKVDRRALGGAALQQATRPEAPVDDVEKVVREIWLGVLPLSTAGPADNFFDCGGDSLSAQRLALALSERFGQGIGVRDVVELPTLGQQAALVRGENPARPSATASRSVLAADVALPPTVNAQAPPAGPALRAVLLTGASGFLGGQLLYDLLRTTGATVYCLVRAAGPHGAYDRIARNLRRYRLWRDDFAERIVGVPGDLGSPRFGLSADDYARLAEKADAVVHSGAQVNLVLGYDALRPANVEGTLEVLKFASTHRTKPVHYVSTLGVAPAGALADAAPVAERPVPDDCALPTDGYTQSKLVGERLVELAGQRGIPVGIYRFGELMPHSVTGVPSQGLPDLLVKACVRLGLSFSSPITMDYTPVDYAGALVAAAVARRQTGYFHVLQPKAVAMDDLLVSFREELGLRDVPYQEFWTALRDAEAADPEDRDLASVLAVMPPADAGTAEEVGRRLQGLFPDNTRLFDTARADELVAAADLRWSPLGTEVFERYAAYYRRPAGTLPAATGSTLVAERG